ncbi:hypothetical protein [Dysgonomonas sp. PH5-45]|nr:hypothetical protein [Dysgonomonas sp. PH5-45]
MKNLKIFITQYLPYIYFIGIAAFWFVDNLSGGHVNYFMIGIASVLIFQIFLKNNILGIILGSILGILSLYMVLAVLSDVWKFDTLCKEAITLLIVGSGFFGTGVVMAILMVLFGIKQLFVRKSICSKNP